MAGESNVIDEGTVTEINNVIEEGENQIDNTPKDKENEDVTPTVNIVDDGVDEGPGEPGVIDEN